VASAGAENCRSACEGVREVLGAVAAHSSWIRRNGELERRRRVRAATEIEAIALAALRRRFDGVHGSPCSSSGRAGGCRRADPYQAADDLIASS